MNQSFTRLSDTGALVPPPFFRETANTSVDPERVRGVCDQCGSVLEPIAFCGYYTRRKCDCELIAQTQVETQRATAEARAQRMRDEAARCYAWLPEQDDSDLIRRDFAGFNPLAQPNSASFVQAKGATLDFAAQVTSSFTRQRVAVNNLTMRGGYGTGKTHLAAAICNALRQVGVSCRFCAVPDLFTALYAAKFEEKQEIIEEAARAPLLVLDDLDKLHVRQETDGEYQKKVLFEVLNGRYKRHVPTLITTNATDDLSRWLDGASLSRLHERLTTLTMIGVDYRRRGNR